MCQFSACKKLMPCGIKFIPCVFARLDPHSDFHMFSIWSKRFANHGAVIDAVRDFLDHCDVGFCYRGIFALENVSPPRAVIFRLFLDVKIDQ